jgi:hypothetical protein
MAAALEFLAHVVHCIIYLKVSLCCLLTAALANGLDVLCLNAYLGDYEIKTDVGSWIEVIGEPDSAKTGAVKINFGAVEKNNVAIVLLAIKPLNSTCSQESSLEFIHP